jgi:hypothetical protein
MTSWMSNVHDKLAVIRLLGAVMAGANASEDFLFPSRLHESPHLGTRQYARTLGHWVDELGLDRAEYGRHSMRRTKSATEGGSGRWHDRAQQCAAL